MSLAFECEVFISMGFKQMLIFKIGSPKFLYYSEESTSEIPQSELQNRKLKGIETKINKLLLFIIGQLLAM